MVIVVVLTLSVSLMVTGSDVASADAGRGVGLTNITTNQFNHPWQGGWITDVGTGWCIQSGAREPRASGNVQIGDVPAERGVALTDRWALSYALWSYGNTTDPVTAAALATVVRGLSGDEWADVNVPAMSVSDSGVKARAVEIYNEAQSRAHWLDGSWHIEVIVEWEQGTTWRSRIRYTNAKGEPIAGHRVDILPDNVVDSEGPGTIREAVTDDNGTVFGTWHQADVSRDIVILTGAWAPAYYSVWAGSNYPSGAAAQNIVTANGTRFDNGSSGRIPFGLGRVRKVTTNRAYQAAVGARFEVQTLGGDTVLGDLVVGSDGLSNAIDLVPGTYQVVEVSAPAGVRIDPIPHEFTVTAGEVTTVDVVDGVEPGASLNLIKTDVVTGEPVSGAVVQVKRDSDGDGDFDEDLGEVTLGLEPFRMDLLVAGRYEITEVTPPEGYLIDAVPTRYVSLNWNETATISFADHKIPTLETFTEEVGDSSSDDESAHSSREELGDVSVMLGATVRDVVVVNGLADQESATINLSLHGPFASPEDLIGGCSDENKIWSREFEVLGSGFHRSPEVALSMPGIYGFVASMYVDGVGQFDGECGDRGESIRVLTPSITTTAQVSSREPGGTVSDIIVVEGLSQDARAIATTTLYGPFDDVEVLKNACAKGDMGTPIGSVDDEIVGSGQHVSSPIKLPSTDYVGIYTFVSTLNIDGLGLIGHDCGIEAETFTIVNTDEDRGKDHPGDVQIRQPERPTRILPRTGIAVGWCVGMGLALVLVGIVTMTLSKRLGRNE